MDKKTASKKIIASKAGFSLIEMIAAIAISGMIVLGTSSIIVNSAKQESSQSRQFWIAARRMEIQNSMRTPAGWNAILAQNPKMSCFADGTSCANVQSPQPLKLPIDSVLLNGSLKTVGLTNKGDFCNSYDEANGNASCPVGIQLEWAALCDDANCKHAQPKLSVNFKLKEPGRSLQNLSTYDLKFFRDPRLESLNEICTAMGGVLTGITCSVASLATSCDPSNSLGNGATYPLGFDNTGKVICGRPRPGTCASTDVATGFDANGGVICAPACF